MMASLNVQARIRHNAETVQDYFKDLQKWRSTIQKSEACGGRTEICVKSPPESGRLAACPSHSLAASPGSSQKDEQFQQPKNRCEHAAGDNSVFLARNSDLVLARDKNSIASYYAAWDRFNVDAELAKLDNEDSKPRTTTRKRDNNEAPAKGTMRAVIKSRESKEAARANTGTADMRSLPNMQQKPKLAGVDNVVQNLHSQLLSALATNQASLLDYSCSRYRSAVKGFRACLSCMEASSHFKAPSPSGSVRPYPSLLSHWRKLRSIFQTNLGFSHLCVARTNGGAECADSAQLDWPESPFVHLLRAACNKMEGNYVQAGRHLREVLAQLTREEPLPLTREASERYSADGPQSTTGHLLAASIAALDTRDFDFLSSTIALTRPKAGGAIPSAVFPWAETQSGNRRRQPRENFPNDVLPQRLSVSEAHNCAGSTDALQDQDPKNTFGCSSPSSATRVDDSTDRKRAGVPDFEASGAHETKTEGLSFPSPRVDLRETVSGELLEILALRQKEAVELRHRRRRQVWQMNEQRLQELDRGSLGNPRFPESNPAYHGDFSAMSSNIKTEEASVECAATSYCGNSESMSGGGTRQNGTARFAFRSTTTRRLHVHVLGDYWYSKHARYERPLKQPLRSREEVKDCRQNRNDLTSGQGSHARPDLHAEKTHEACSRHSECLSVASTEANDGQLSGESISLSHCMEAETEAGGAPSVRDKRSDVFQVISADTAIAAESVIPLLPRIKAMPEVLHATSTLPGSQRTNGNTTTLCLPPSTYLSFRQRWYAACSHGMVTECRAKLDTIAATGSSGLGVTQQQNKKSLTRKPSLQCLPCLQNKLTLLGTLAEHHLFSRVFKSSLEPEILADVLEVVAEGLRYTVMCTDGNDPTQSGCSQHATRTSTLGGGDADLVNAPLPRQPSESRGPLLSRISMPERKRWPGLTCVHSILVQLSEVPRFWSVVYQFDQDELCILQQVLRSCLQHSEISARTPKDDSLSTSSGVHVLQPRHRPVVPSGDSHAYCYLTDRLREVQAKLPNVDK